MMKLIDVDELRKTMYHEAFESDTDMQKWDSGCWIRYKMFENVIENTPTIDAEPVKHGHWELIGGYRYIGGYGYQYRCSNCIKCAEHRTKYCPNCGAKMVEVNDETN